MRSGWCGKGDAVTAMSGTAACSAMTATARLNGTY
jgi:hypothetical protein